MVHLSLPPATTPDPMGAGATSRSQIFLVEDHPITRAGLVALLAEVPDWDVCGQADAAPTALEMIVRLRPDLVVIDIALKTSSGLELIKNLLAHLPDLRILVMTMHGEDLYAERAIRAGARGYLMKQEAAEKLIPAIRVILGNDIYLSPRMKGRLLGGMLARANDPEHRLLLQGLSDREMEVLQLIGNGFNTRAIATRLHLSPKTIDSYRERMKDRLKLESSAELMRLAIQWTRSESIVET